MSTTQKTAYIRFALGVAGATAALILLFLPQSVAAYFSDDAVADGNDFSIGTLTIDIDDDTLDANVAESGTTSVSFETSSTGSVTPQYEITATASACPGSFYNGVDVEVTKGSTVYMGSLSSLIATSTSDGEWELSFSASSTLTAYEDEECEVTLTVHAWQDNFPLMNTGGFSDEEDITLTLTATEFIGQTIVLNEVLPNPFGDDWQNESDGEWVELFNNSGDTLDLDGWYVEDEGGTRRTIGTMAAGASTTPAGETEILPFGWLVVYMNAQVLNNDGDIVSLYDAGGTLRDQYAYGTYATSSIPESGLTPGDTNGTTTVASTTTSGAEGKSDARIPDGIGEWIDPDPTAGEPNYVSEADLEALGYSEEQIDFMMERQRLARERYEKARAALEEKEEEEIPPAEQLLEEDAEILEQDELLEGEQDDDLVEEPAEDTDPEVDAESGTKDTNSSGDSDAEQTEFDTPDVQDKSEEANDPNEDALEDDVEIAEGEEEKNGEQQEDATGDTEDKAPEENIKDGEANVGQKDEDIADADEEDRAGDDKDDSSEGTDIEAEEPVDEGDPPSEPGDSREDDDSGGDSEDVGNEETTGDELDV